MLIQNNFSLAGVAFQASVQVSADIADSIVTSIVAAQPSSLTTRTDNATGTLTMTNSGHGIVTGQKIDLYWSGGSRRFVTVGTVSGTSVPFSVGSGTNLPAALTAINVGIPNKRACNLVNANLVALAWSCNWESQFTFMESDLSTEDYQVHLVPTSNGLLTSGCWYLGLATNPLANTAVAWVYISHADPANAHNATVAYLTN